jgi:hypothetical protein
MATWALGTVLRFLIPVRHREPKLHPVADPHTGLHPSFSLPLGPHAAQISIVATDRDHSTFQARIL